MDVNALVHTLSDGLNEYARATEKISRCLPALEKTCGQIIREIQNSSEVDADNKFDQLLQLQGILSKAVFIHGIDVGERLMIVVKEFERLHDPYIREYWFKQFKGGLTWPTIPSQSPTGDEDKEGGVSE